MVECVWVDVWVGVGCVGEGREGRKKGKVKRDREGENERRNKNYRDERGKEKSSMNE